MEDKANAIRKGAASRAMLMYAKASVAIPRTRVRRKVCVNNE